MSSPVKTALEISTSMARVRPLTTTGSVMAPASISAKRARNSNQLDLFASLFIDPADAAAPLQNPPEQVKVQDGREEPLAANDPKALAGPPAPDGRGAAQEEPAGAGDSGGGAANVQLTTVSYNDTDGSRVVTNPLGVQDTYSFTTLQGAQKVSGISRAATATTAAATRSFTYDANGYLATATDWNGNTTTYTNNAHGLPTKIVEPSRTTTISYDPTFVHLPHQITTTGFKSVFAYDTSGNLHTRMDTDTTTQTIPYSTSGQTRIWTYNYTNFLLTSVQNPRTDLTIVTQYGYGPDGALTSITDPLTHATNITSHTGGGRPLTIVDPNSVTTTLTYDQRQRLTTSAVTTSTGVLTTTYTIDPTGELKQLQLPDGSTLTYTHDTAHRLTQVTDTQNNYTQYTPDALSDVTAINVYNNAGGLRYQHSATFDALGRILTDVGGAGQTTTYSNYDNNGNPQTITDPLTNPTTQVFDALNRLTQITDANTGITKFAYDTHNRTTKVTDANVHATSYVYDGFGDAIQQTSPDSGVTVFYYDGDRNITTKVDALGVTVNMTYDKLDRVATRSYPADGSQFVGYQYDQSGGTFGFGVGRLTTTTDPMGTHNLQYEERGNIVAHRRFTNPGGVSLGHIFFAYDQASRLSNITYPSGMTLYYNRDSIGNIYKVTLTTPGSSTRHTVAFAAYEPFGPVYSLTFGNNESENLQFDNDYRMLEATDTNTSSVNLMDQVYGYDAANNLKTVTDNLNAANNQTLGYDVLNRLHTAAGNYGSYKWMLDKVGNLKTLKIGSVTTTYTYTTGTNQIATLKVGTNPAVTVTTNANGNIASIPPANSSTAATFSYDVTNRLSGVTGSPTAATFVYDAFGERYSKTNPSSSPTTYAYDFSGNLLEETISGAVTDYVYLNGMPLAVFVPGGTSGTAYYVHTDRQGTPQLVTNSAQAAVWSTSYQPYGTTPTVVSSIVQNVRFPGQHFDLETGFHYNNARDYMPNLGRYLEADPMGLFGGLNGFLYANANPATFIDPSGSQQFGPYNLVDSQTATIRSQNQPSGPSGADVLNGISTVSGLVSVGAGFLGAEPVAVVAGAISICTAVAAQVPKQDPFSFGLDMSAVYGAKAVNASPAAAAYIDAATIALHQIHR
jgi:RHS repeat-associated protein